MKTNKIDSQIKKKLENRTFEPSASAWERLSVQLDQQPKQKKMGWFFYIGAAASILLLVTIGIQLFTKDSNEIIPKDIIVISPIDTIVIDNKINDFINEIPVQEALVKENRVEVEEQKSNVIITTKEKLQPKNFKIKSIKKESIVIAKVEENKENIVLKEIEKVQPQNSSKEIEKRVIKQDPNSTIKINADDLLYAVTHSPTEVKKYYAKYNVNREDVLNAIQNELIKSNIKVNPNTILAEVERTINDDDFQNNFMKSLKRRVSDIASAIASRND